MREIPDNYPELYEQFHEDYSQVVGVIGTKCGFNPCRFYLYARGFDRNEEIPEMLIIPMGYKYKGIVPVTLEYIQFNTRFTNQSNRQWNRSDEGTICDRSRMIKALLEADVTRNAYEFDKLVEIYNIIMKNKEVSND